MPSTAPLRSLPLLAVAHSPPSAFSMCNLNTEGFKYGCGHYIIEHKKSKIDCNNPRCVHSRRHKLPCPNCSCEKYLGPDASETVLGTRPGFCPECKPWYKSQNGGR